MDFQVGQKTPFGVIKKPVDTKTQRVVANETGGVAIKEGTVEEKNTRNAQMMLAATNEAVENGQMTQADAIKYLNNGLAMMASL